MNPLIDTVDTISKLKEAADLFEVTYRNSFICSTFNCIRKTKNGEYQEVEVEIQDAGPEAGAIRYSCTATSEDGKIATGNPDRSVDGVFSTLHWQNLDK
jgi:hypothetical protein